MAASEAPNFLVIDIDSLRADRLLARRDGAPVAPGLTRLAERGTCFQQAIAQSGWTMPGLCALLTGRWPVAVIAEERRLDWAPPGARTLPGILALYGYRTALAAGPTLVDSPTFGAQFGTRLGVEEGDRGGPVAPMTRWVAAQAEEPFFALLHDVDLHMFGRGLPPEGVCRWVAEPGACEALLTRPPQELRPAGPGRVEAAQVAAIYDGALASYDEALGPLFEALEVRGFAARTVVILTSNHGEDLGEHGVFGHGLHYDTVLRVPLVIFDPRVPAWQERAIPGMVQTVDIAPTVLALAGVPTDEAMVGRSLVPWMDGTALGPSAEMAFSLSDLAIASARTETGKLLYHPEPLPGGRKPPLGALPPRRVERYDLVRDPGEREPLASPGEPDPFQAALDAWLAARQAEAPAAAPVDDPRLRERLQRDGYWRHVRPDGGP